MKKIKDWFLSLAIGRGFLKFALINILAITLLVQLAKVWPIFGYVYTILAIYFFIVCIATLIKNIEKLENEETIEL